MKAIAELPFVKNASVSETPFSARLCALLCTLLIGLPQISAAAKNGQSPQAKEPIFVGDSYIGPAACQGCHPDKYEGFIQTAHHITSRLADAHSIAGDFTEQAAFMWTRNDDLWFEMSARADGFYQTANIMGKDNKLHEHSERMEIVTGSGKIGQTYLYWKGNRLYQLPISYWTASGKWINSPGFPDGQAVFDRPVGPRCMECHATHFETESYERNVYGQEEFMLGISCERCHGPGAEHAQFQVDAPDGAGAPHITHPGNLSRQRSIEICAQCHSGAGIKHGRPFTYRPGLPLAKYIEPEPHDTQNRIGVHSNNQVARLSLSACFQQSDDLACASCHNPHAPERGDRTLFSSRCLDCHSTEACGMQSVLGHAIVDNCIDCHMPGRQDKKTGVQSARGMDFPVMPEHLIGIYPDATQRFMARRAADN
ncbi:MAG: multiheme c-type cytochrome [Candidatus Latescibacterota bacterium]|nr:multiheme c-type cytochrome [Candidatus Latescibacterota bacterium]